MSKQNFHDDQHSDIHNHEYHWIFRDNYDDIIQKFSALLWIVFSFADYQFPVFNTSTFRVCAMFTSSSTQIYHRNVKTVRH
jgi:hypothetical protein